MAERDDPDFRRRYGGCYVATRDGDVIASDRSYEQLSVHLERTVVEWRGVVVEYVDPFDVVRVSYVSISATPDFAWTAQRPHDTGHGQDFYGRP